MFLLGNVWCGLYYSFYFVFYVRHLCIEKRKRFFKTITSTVTLSKLFFICCFLSVIFIDNVALNSNWEACLIRYATPFLFFLFFGLQDFFGNQAVEKKGNPRKS